MELFGLDEAVFVQVDVIEQPLCKFLEEYCGYRLRSHFVKRGFHVGRAAI
jgi:hypothetical protein